MDKINVKMVLSYDGSKYNGYQSQTHGNTIEDLTKKAIASITGCQIVLYCAGRTDTGVHAEGQVVNFFTDKHNLTEKNWLKALNSYLPFNIRIGRVSFETQEFNARRSAVMREYSYSIVNNDTISAMENRYAILYRYPLDEKLLQQYADVLVGVHDFTSFCATGDVSRVKIRHIKQINVIRTGKRITIRIVANAFLHNMIRIIIGTLFDLHKNGEPVSVMKQILEAKERQAAGKTIAARGLVFKRVYYPGDEITW